MSDLMRDAVISMPLELAMGDEWSRFQFHNRAQELLKQVHSLEAERDQWEVDCREEVIMRREAEAERDRLREALKDLLQWAIDVHDPRVQSKINYSGMDAARQALEEAR